MTNGARSPAPRLGSRLMNVLQSRTFVTPSLRKVLEALPDDPGANPAQADAAAALVVFNAWICCGDAALDLLQAMDAATGAALALYPRDEEVAVAVPEEAARLQVVMLGLATKLGFSPAHRVKVAVVVSELAGAIAAQGGTARVVIAVNVSAPRALVVRLEEERASSRPELGSGRALGLHRVRATADEIDVRTDARGLLRVTAHFLASPRTGAPT